MSPQGQQIIQMVAGLLGAAAGMGGGPLAGPITSGLPQAPGGSVGGTGQAALPQPGGPSAPGGPASALGSRIKQAAYNLPDPYPYKSGTQGGVLGCADVVSHALIEAGAMNRSEHDLAVAGVNRKLRAKGWQEAGRPYQGGDVIVWGPTSSGTHKHIGIIVVENGQVYAINNSSSQKRAVKVLLSSMSRRIEAVIRTPGSVAS